VTPRKPAVGKPKTSKRATRDAADLDALLAENDRLIELWQWVARIRKALEPVNLARTMLKMNGGKELEGDRLEQLRYGLSVHESFEADLNAYTGRNQPPHELRKKYRVRADGFLVTEASRLQTRATRIRVTYEFLMQLIESHRSGSVDDAEKECAAIALGLAMSADEADEPATPAPYAVAPATTPARDLLRDLLKQSETWMTKGSSGKRMPPSDAAIRMLIESLQLSKRTIEKAVWPSK
jgi:hypothetical protein